MSYYYWRYFIALQDEIWGGADEEHIIYAYALALGSKFMMETFLSLAIRTTNCAAILITAE